MQFFLKKNKQRTKMVCSDDQKSKPMQKHMNECLSYFPKTFGKPGSAKEQRHNMNESHDR